MKKIQYVFLTMALLALGNAGVVAKVWHVSVQGSDTSNGSSKSPFATISKAAYQAIAGDTVLIHGGVYREWVSPANGGISPARRIVYMAAPGEDVWLKGSEVVTGWKKESKGVWKVEVPNVVFGDFNPFALNVFGDWLQKGKSLHLGEVYLDGKALTEASGDKELASKAGTWHAVVTDEVTVIRANFDGRDPNKALTEVNARPTCFFPKTTGVNYITVKGLKIGQAATQWSAPTSEQIGIIGPNWSLGWVIEDCEISQSKCVGVCLGKERASGHNMWSLYRKKFGYMKDGFNREIEAIFKAYDLGWSKENIGSHLVQNNKIYDCGQAGIVGHMGAAFSVIRNNEIYNINRTNGMMTGAETAGIKLHAAIDARLENNCIVNTVMGIWLDWQAQGTHVVGNIISESEKQDMFFEVTHGPTLVYNNICLSELNLLVKGQGIAFFNNLLSGRVQAGVSPERYTPYHFPHSTKVKGLFNNTGGDVRFYNNLFLANAPKGKGTNGLATYRNYPVYAENLSDSVRSTPDYLKFLFPVWTCGNVYFKNGEPYRNEFGHLQFPQSEATAKLEKRADGYYLNLSVDIDLLKQVKTCAVNTDMLGQTFISEALFENPDGTPFFLKTDFFGRVRNERQPVPGPFEGKIDGVVWKCNATLGDKQYTY
ncbi:right-handed parallel beta-helix repeat-containing protein [Bacteroides cellulosilyticus]|uniref:right-handed parallel beta-helix repeat-containing protein n=1 Tax=Bacteroides cellulosilyticus TaxID=246787 RepID=UPI001C37A7B9|nr:right-handed parallel beta-helix repeat-containing protein [Bacteroides cellulosilyticus]MBV3639171.1 right-handed parallel beta-helix repeat-containing protein [Bacteroides cellulosilyticus]MBV3664313.1 right-handed parallel beta-helix repeat-containing protein [Bacteroides cellulosilyticus]MBV3686214.1 right-handed parallel beta-helix repeat-containing protein [Bacteroides cellulosilyticus]MBV3694795.1 right-handed parallel beta-helix repeat-containing protein [Bacteroides cellulosilyticus